MKASLSSGTRRGAFVAAIASAAIFGGTALAPATDLAITKPAVAVTKPASNVERALMPMPRARPAAIRLPATVWLPQRRPSSLVRIVSVMPALPRWSFYPIIHGVGF